MKIPELFSHIKEVNYIKSGKSLDWFVEIDDNLKVIRLLFQESQDKTDWFHNLYFFSKIYKKQESVLVAHSGFGNEYKSGNNDIMHVFINQCLEHPGYRAVIAGWSNGGAMAQLAAEDFNYRTRQDKKCPDSGWKSTLVTFGSPKVVVGKKSRNYLKSCCYDIYQIANINDMVTYVAPFPWFHHLDLPKDKRVGESFKLKKFFKPTTYHCNYDIIGYPQSLLSVEV